MLVHSDLFHYKKIAVLGGILLSFQGGYQRYIIKTHSLISENMTDHAVFIIINFVKKNIVD